jgi:5-methylcytosine-specific restriction endonuclease McrA
VSVSVEEQRARWREANRRYRATEKGMEANRRAIKKGSAARVRRWYYAHLETRRFIARVEMSQQRAKRWGARIVESVTGENVWRRDNGLCYLCGLPVEMLKMSIDHVIPLSKGGEHSYANCRLTHARCNRKKYNKILEIAQ